MIRFALKQLAVLALMSCASAVNAGLLVGTGSMGNGGFGVGFSADPSVNLIIGQQFGLNSHVNADSITVYLNGNGQDPPQSDFTLQVMDQIGEAATDEDVLLTRVGTFPAAILPFGRAPVTFDHLNLSLAAGAYYLVISSADGQGSGWRSGAAELPSGLGTVGSAFMGIASDGALATYTTLDPSSPNEGHADFRIDSAVPEPGSCASLLCGIALLGVGHAAAKRKCAAIRTSWTVPAD